MDTLADQWAAMEFNALTQTLNHFLSVFQQAHGHLLPHIRKLLALLGAIELTLTGLWWALGGGERVASAFRKLLFLTAWLWVSLEFPALASAFVNSLVRAGFIAAGQSGSDVSLLMDPSRIAGMGLDATAPLVSAMDKVTFDPGTSMVMGLCYLGIMLCFLVMAFQVFYAMCEYHLQVALCAVLVPFGVFGPTKFIAEKAIGSVVASGVKLMALAFILSIVAPVLGRVRFSHGDVVKFNELWAVALMVFTLCMLTWKVPQVVAGMLAGTPSLSAGDSALHAAALGKNVMAFASHAGGAAQRVVQAGARQLGAAYGGARLGAGGVAGSGGGVAAQVGAAAEGGVKAASASLVRSAMGSVDAGFGGVRRSFDEGQLVAFEALVPTAAAQQGTGATAQGAPGTPAAPTAARPAWVQAAAERLQAGGGATARKG